MSKVSVSSLEGIRILAGLTPAEHEDMAKACSWKTYRADEQIIDRQSESRDVLFVVKGRVRIVLYSLSGREIALDEKAAGDYFGELAALDGEPRSASVVALEESVIAALPPEAFMRLLRDHPEVVVGVMQRMSRVIRRATERIMDLSTLGANNRVHAELLREARAAMTGDNTAVLSPIPTHTDIASRVSTTRETVARVLNDLARSGVVKREKDSLVITDVDRLMELVEEVRGE